MIKQEELLEVILQLLNPQRSALHFSFPLLRLLELCFHSQRLSSQQDQECNEPNSHIHPSMKKKRGILLCSVEFLRTPLRFLFANEAPFSPKHNH